MSSICTLNHRYDFEVESFWSSVFQVFNCLKEINQCLAIKAASLSDLIGVLRFVMHGGPLSHSENCND